MRVKLGLLAAACAVSVVAIGASAAADETTTTVTSSTVAGSTTTVGATTSTAAATTTTTTIACPPPTTTALPTTTASPDSTTTTIAGCVVTSVPTTTAAPASTTSTTTTTTTPTDTIGPATPGSGPPIRGTQVATATIPPPPTTTTTTTTTTIPAPPPAPTWGLPGNSGSGRRVVYSKSYQRVWVVDASGAVIKTHLVSGKKTPLDPRPGTYTVWSRSRYTHSIANPSITWGYMVRFAWGANGGNIGLHEIPYQYGYPVQSISQLGQPLSGGCVRQAKPDAIWMWNWAQLGTKVVVLG